MGCIISKKIKIHPVSERKITDGNLVLTHGVSFKESKGFLKSTEYTVWIQELSSAYKHPIKNRLKSRLLSAEEDSLPSSNGNTPTSRKSTSHRRGSYMAVNNKRKEVHLDKIKAVLDVLASENEKED